ncbi:cell wall-binding repeat-containing protein [Ornithinimicrobium faecis]|uniref:Cell wall-binding repeat-containing protein n=1 Tax=Ornithinimicrobium faecis TaxID=2934158 RepID=A0ABY4YWL9_9MICO|nr:cell wall-binding repeat-containing protein [Ornithinimicrobium sp. HY1793]USQ81178.1 cell wall-binding repeat-containing protein [Ornithinimicrobium sp. HY1793]
MAQGEGAEHDVAEKDAAGEASPDEVSVHRIQGEDRYATAANMAENFGDPDRVYLASGEEYFDALSGSPAAILDGAPVLLTKSDHLPQHTESALRALEPKEVVVVGGTEAIADDVLTQVEEQTGADVTRVSGENRYGTAMFLATERFEAKFVTHVYVASGEDYADALSGGTSAGAEGSPILLTQHGNLPAETSQALDELDPALVTVLGGEEAVSDEVLAEIGGHTDEVRRVAGKDRYETSALLAETTAPGETALVASGEDFPDALAGTALAGHLGLDVPLLLTQPDNLPEVTGSVLSDREPEIVELLGGELTINDSVGQEIEELLAE